MDAQEQVVEVNRIRQMIGEALKEETFHARELSLALVSIAIQAHIQNNVFSLEEAREQLKEMIDYLIDHTQLIGKKDIQ